MGSLQIVDNFDALSTFLYYTNKEHFFEKVIGGKCKGELENTTLLSYEFFTPVQILISSF